MTGDGRPRARRPARSLIAAGVLAAAAAAAAATMTAGRAGAGGPAAATPRPVPSLADADTLEIERAGARTTLRREAGTLRVTAPVAAPADETNARAAFAAIGALDWVALVTDRPAGYAALGVDDRAGVRVIAKRAGQTLAALVVGKVVEGDTMTMVRIAPGGAVWQVSGDLKAIVDRPPVEWRDRAITRFAPAEARRIEVGARDGARIVLERASASDDWRVRESTDPIAALDPFAVRELVDTLSALSASGFADGLPPEAAGLAPPALVVRVGLAGGGAASVLVGEAKRAETAETAETYVGLPDRAQIYLVPQFNVERFARRPIQFRDKTLCDISDEAVLAFEVSHAPASYAVARAGSGWRALRPAGFTPDPEKVGPLASVFRGWRAPRIAEHPPAGVLDRLRAVVVGRSAHARCTIRVGRETPDGAGYFVGTARSPDVFEVPKWMVDRLRDPGRVPRPPAMSSHEQSSCSLTRCFPAILTAVRPWEKPRW
jgi:hypothetical protein